MAHLYEELAQRVAGWRSAGYPSEENPAVGEILDYGIDDQTGYPRFLRSAQLLALETYWYLRLVEHTPHFQHRLVGRPRAQIRPGLGPLRPSGAARGDHRRRKDHRYVGRGSSCYSGGIACEQFGQQQR